MQGAERHRQLWTLLEEFSFALPNSVLNHVGLSWFLAGTELLCQVRRECRTGAQSRCRKAGSEASHAAVVRGFSPVPSCAWFARSVFFLCRLWHSHLDTNGCTQVKLAVAYDA